VKNSKYESVDFEGGLDSLKLHGFVNMRKSVLCNV